MKNKKILTKTVLLLGLVSLFTDIASEMLYPIMPLYLKSIGFGVALIGVLEGVAEALAGLSKGYFGAWSDKIGLRMSFVRFGYLLSALAKPLMAAFTSVGWIFGVRSLDRLGKGIRTSARDALLSSESTPENKGKVFGFHRAMDTLGATIGPSIALVFLIFMPGQYKLLFLLAFIPGIISIWTTTLIKEKPLKIVNKTTEPSKNQPFRKFLTYFSQSDRDYKKLFFGLIAFALFNSSDAFLLLVMKNNGLSDIAVVGVYIFYNLIYALSAYPLGGIADKIGFKKTLIGGLIMFSIVYTGIVLQHSFWISMVLFMIYGVYAAATESISKARISNIVPKTQTATAIGFFLSFQSIAVMLASSLTGIIRQFFGPLPAFFVSASGTLLVAGYFAVMKVREKN